MPFLWILSRKRSNVPFYKDVYHWSSQFSILLGGGVHPQGISLQRKHGLITYFGPITILSKTTFKYHFYSFPLLNRRVQVFCLYTRTHIVYMPGAGTVRRGLQISWKWSCQSLWTILEVLGFKPLEELVVLSAEASLRPLNLQSMQDSGWSWGVACVPGSHKAMRSTSRMAINK